MASRSRTSVNTDLATLSITPVVSCASRTAGPSPRSQTRGWEYALLTAYVDGARHSGYFSGTEITLLGPLLGVQNDGGLIRQKVDTGPNPAPNE
ncbi:hypothetical protein GCM10025787_40520 [Saccharopolyspora rosea]